MWSSSTPIYGTAVAITAVTDRATQYTPFSSVATPRLKLFNGTTYSPRLPHALSPGALYLLDVA